MIVIKTIQFFYTLIFIGFKICIFRKIFQLTLRLLCRYRTDLIDINDLTGKWKGIDDASSILIEFNGIEIFFTGLHGWVLSVF